ncbi:hypothetical protein BKH41_03795 [Helicobacter sp. 12S02232-10]|uniref:DUF4376 domain-containing protein n=1 Tax=Helicobacter sp. 12S02232-10 TaxID=1476197 RepID=UPI000BA58479|nr:hypothetical protein [Helicobacter sp. 12S02232-10]PAF49213.1 hypothetical protein BKH41_03795 [Helicobacter sp. 12S02232-10]
MKTYKTYKIPLEKITDVQGEFKSITSDSEFVYIQSEIELKDPFMETQLPTHYLESIKEALDYAKIKATTQMNQACDKHLEKLTSNALGTPHIYDMAQEDQINLMGLVLAGIDSFFRCAPIDDPFNKQNIPHTKVQLKKLYADALEYKAKMLFKCGELKEAINQAQTLQALQAIDWIDEKESEDKEKAEDIRDKEGIQTQEITPSQNNQNNENSNQEKTQDVIEGIKDDEEITKQTTLQKERK